MIARVAGLPPLGENMTLSVTLSAAAVSSRVLPATVGVRVNRTWPLLVAMALPGRTRRGSKQPLRSRSRSRSCSRPEAASRPRAPSRSPSRVNGMRTSLAASVAITMLIEGTVLGFASPAPAASTPTLPGQTNCGDIAGPVWHLSPQEKTRFHRAAIHRGCRQHALRGRTSSDSQDPGFDEGEHVVAAQRDRPDGGEVRRERARRLPAEELAPTRPVAPRPRLKPSCREQAV